MFSKTRTTFIASVSAAVALSLSAGAASAAMLVHPASPAPARVVQPTSVPKVKEAGSAGISRYTNKVCQALAGAYNAELEVVEQAAKDKNAAVATEEAGRAAETYSELSSNCLVVD